MENITITEDQKDKIKKLERSLMINSILSSAKNMFLLIAMSVLTIYMDLVYIKSDTFLTLTSLFNGMLFARLSYLDFISEKQRVLEELNKILVPKE